MKLQWLPQLTIDRGVIDAEHKHLFKLYNDALNAAEEGNQEQSETLLDKMYAYAMTHFRHEEDLMAASNYPLPRWQSHKEHHAEFFVVVRKLQAGPQYAVLDYLQEWLLRHVMTDDLLFGKYMAEQGKDEG